MSTQRIYLIGAGHIARSHAQTAQTLFGDAAGTTLELHVCDHDPAALGAFAEKFPGVRNWDDAKQMLADAPQPSDVVVVATPPKSHHALTLLALRSGRHTLCEKPLAMNADEAQEMLAAARKADRLLGCCSTRFIGDERSGLRDLLAGARDLYAGRWIDLRHRSRSGVEYQSQTPWFMQRAYNGGGCLMDWGPYDVTTLDYLLQPQTVTIRDAWVKAPQIAANLPEGIQADVDTHVGATLIYDLADDRRVAIQYQRASAFHGENRGEFAFYGQTFGLQLDLVPKGAAKLFQDDDGKARTEETPDTGSPASRPLGERPLAYFVQRISEGDGPALVQERAVFNFLILQGIYQAADQSRDVRVVREPDPALELI